MPLIERVLDPTVRATLQDHVDHGGGVALDAARRVEPEAVIGEAEAAGLRGRGGAGFPTGTKWRTVAAARSRSGATPVVVNAAEGEPATFKDRELLRRNPYKVLEGALIAAAAVQATQVIVALKGSFAAEIERVTGAVAELAEAGWTDGLTVDVVGGPGEYLFGEETALLEVIEGRQPFPRVTPPYRRGLELDDESGNPASDVRLVEPGGAGASPTLVDNVETLANVPGILANGAAWYRELGTPESPGTLVCTMSGHCRVHAVAEVPMGTPLSEAISLIAQGPRKHRRIVGALSGVANPIVPGDLLDTPLTYEAMAAIASGLGAGGFYLLDDATDLAAVAHGVARFLAIESCGQCEPCKRDGLAIAAHLAAICSTEATARDVDEVRSRLATVADNNRCSLAEQHERVVASALRLFPEAFEAHVAGTAGPVQPEPILPIVDIVDGRAVLDTTHLGKQPDWSHDEVDSGEWPAASLGEVPVRMDRPRLVESQEGHTPG